MINYNVIRAVGPHLRIRLRVKLRKSQSSGPGRGEQLVPFTPILVTADLRP